MENRKNTYPGKCSQCGGVVEPGEGWISREQLSDGSYGWSKPEHDECPEKGAARVEVPVWLQYVGPGRTVAGNHAERGAVRRTGTPPADAVSENWVPVNEAAATSEALPAAPRRSHDEHRAEMLARFGHTEASWNHGQPEPADD